MKNISIPRILSIIVGIVFIFSGLVKLLDVSAFQNLIIQYGLSLFHYLAPLIILLEILLGMALLLGIYQKITAIATICMLLVFTGAYTYGYLVNSVEDCGCFGSLVKSTPTITYTRNVLLIAILVIIVLLDKTIINSVPQWKVIILLAIMIPSIFAAGMTFRIIRHNNDSHPFEGMNVSETPLKNIIGTDDKSKLVLFMSYQCQHCWNSIENYKAYVENGFVDTSLCYALCASTQSGADSVALLFKESYPEVTCQDVIKDSASFIEVTPTAFFIEGDKVTKIIIGGLPSPFLLFQGRKTD